MFSKYGEHIIPLWSQICISFDLSLTVSKIITFFEKSANFEKLLNCQNIWFSYIFKYQPYDPKCFVSLYLQPFPFKNFFRKNGQNRHFFQISQNLEKLKNFRDRNFYFKFFFIKLVLLFTCVTDKATNLNYWICAWFIVFVFY